MITSEAFRGKRYAVLGLARSGAATVRALLASGARVTAWDSDEGKRNQLLSELARGGGPPPKAVVEGQSPTSERPLHHPAGGPPPRDKLGEELGFADPLLIDLAGYDGVVVSPGVPLNRHPIAAHARAAGVPVIGDIELFAQGHASLPPHKVVGITGTNGKSTTTALVHHILVTAGVPATLGGNIGLPILGQDPLPAGGVYVLELSSYQIDLLSTLPCDVAVLTNITPDHLDRYESFEAYANAKAWLFDMQQHDQVAVIAVDDEQTRRISDEFDIWGIGQQCIRVRAADCPDQSGWPALQGPHNAQNAVCAITTAIQLGVPLDTIIEGLRTYPGLPHRMERVVEKGGVLYVNDSKATNATSTAPALAAFPPAEGRARLRWILGGRAKTDDLDACAPYYGNVRAAYTIGEAGPMFARLLSPHMPVSEAGTLDRAVAQAANDAEAGDVVLLSPACASFDQFRDFEARGDAFRAAVGGI